MGFTRKKSNVSQEIYIRKFKIDMKHLSPQKPTQNAHTKIVPYIESEAFAIRTVWTKRVTKQCTIRVGFKIIIRRQNCDYSTFA